MLGSWSVSISHVNRILNLFSSMKYYFLPLLGFEKPSAIQQRAIRPIIKGRDVIAQ